MHIFQYLVGITFYPLLWFAINNSPIQIAVVTLISIFCLNTFAILQLICHVKLAQNNRTPGKLPDSVFFKYLVCPNYTCEVLIYLSLAIGKGGFLLNLIFLFVLLNQTLSAVDKKEYYKLKDRYAIFYLII
jgi:hypothetical protein